MSLPRNAWRILLVLLLLLCITFIKPLPAYAVHRGSTVAVSSSCPQGTYNGISPVIGALSDGCPDAPSGTPDNIVLFEHPDYFTSYAPQSGQAYTTRPPWNVAGVDYPAGVDRTVIAGNGGWKDPYTEYLAGRFPAGCTVGSNTNSIGGGYIHCTTVSGDLTISGYDMSGSLTGSGICYVIGINSPTGSYTLNYTNNYHGLQNAGCLGNSNAGFADQIFPGTGWATANFDNDVWDYSPPITGSGSAFHPISLGGTVGTQYNFKYSVFHNVPANPINGNPAPFGLLLAYNYIDSYVFDVTNQGHAEVTDLNGAGTRTTYYWFFNNILRGSSVGIGSGTANVWLSAVSSGTFSDAEELYNVTIDNCNPSAGSGPACRNSLPGYETMEASLAYFNNTHTATYVENNYDDYTGALYVGISATATCTVPIVWTGNTDLVSGSTISGFTNQGVNNC